ncbi:hypothetical protein KIN20_009168 [Parelaphostrongylus tenuis]|uniref:Schwannomin interacting protein 1 C-terminal domain-containing protein n=1 Tax=Parelaphostrongylus tenuis TaxID=148309 RepID=A0AAD5M7U2_PARTN|nr:hypothetical protein KIN20_009168 [Parelaphostrongylus tenuis]
MLAQQPAKLPHSLLEEGSATSPSLTSSISCTVSLSLNPDVRDDSGVSTMESICSKQFELAIPMSSVSSTASTLNTVQTLANILQSNHNNNYTGSMDVVKLLQLRSVDDEQNQQSNTSSLESLSSLENHQGSQIADADGCSGSTSCSEDSFEMSSTCSARDSDVSPQLSPRKEGGDSEVASFSRQDHMEAKEPQGTTCESLIPLEIDGMDNTGSDEPSSNNNSSDRCSSLSVLCQPPCSISMDSFVVNNTNMKAIRESINLELENLDTGLPELDFVKLEEQLTNAAREREEHDRRLLGEEVRRRLALQVDSWKGGSPVVSTRPHRSNLALRLQTAMHLQVCYMNELAESASESDLSESEDEFMLPRSRSTPNLKGISRPGSSKEDPYLQKLRDQAINEQHLDQCERQALLHGETRKVLKNAKKAAELALHRHRSTKSRASDVPRQARQYLRKMSISEVLRIKETIEEAIDQKNLELVQLLIERDSLHMEHDSLLVDIDDFTEHEAECSALDFPYLLGMMDGRIASPSCSTGSDVVAYGKLVERADYGDGTSHHVGPPAPAPTPTSPTKALVAQLPKSLTRLVLFRR